MADLKTALLIALQTTGEERVAKLRQSLVDLGISADKAEDLAAGLDTELKQVADSSGAAEKKSLDLAGALKTMAGAAIVREFFQVNASFESMRKTLELVTGSSEAASAEMAFVRAEANRLGIEVAAAASSYIQLSASAKGTALEGASVREIWSSLVGAMAALGKSAADVDGVVTQLSQGISKGKFELEDLKGVAERIPGFFKLFADALGVTTDELFSMISAGEVTADKLPALAEALGKVQGSTDTANAALGRLKNAWTDAQLALGDTGVLETMTTALKGATIIVAGLWESITLVGKAFGNLAYSMASLDFSGYQQRQQEAVDQARANLARVMESTLGVADASKQAGDAAEQMAVQVAAAAKVQVVDLDEAGIAAKQLAQAYKDLGIQSQEALDEQAARLKTSYDLIVASGAPLAVQSQAWAKYAEAAIAANGGVADSTIRAEAATRGYTLAVDEAGKTTVQLSDKTRQLTLDKERQAETLQRLIATLESEGVALERAGYYMDTLRGGIGTLQSTVDGAIQTMQRLGGATSSIINTARQAVTEATNGSLAALERLERAVDSSATTFQAYFYGIWDAQQKIIDQYNAEHEAMLRMVEGLKEGAINADNLTYSFGLLGAEDLGPLRQAISDAQSRLRSLEADAAATLATMRDELDQLNGEYDDIERRRAEIRQAEILAKIAEARAAGDNKAVADLTEALALLKTISAERIREAAERERAERAERARTGQTARTITGGDAGGVQAGGTASPGATYAAPGATYHITLPVLAGTLDEAARVLQPYLDRAARFRA